ncbi:MAG TPA: SCO family protein [Conexibacter sp.]
MPARLRLTVAVITSIVVAALAAIVVFGGSDSDSGSPSSPDPSGFSGALRPPGARALDFRLTDQDGKHVTMRQFRGRDVVVTFMYSTCEDTCPLTAQQIRGALDDLGHDVPVLAISVDPRDDTPFHVKRFLVREQMAGRMRYLTGTRAQLAPIWKAYGIQPQLTETSDPNAQHTASTVVVDGRGMQRLGFLTNELTPEGLAGDLRRLGAA